MQLTTTPRPTISILTLMSKPTIALTERTFDDLYRREFPGLVAVATALSGADGEDIVHDAMVKALANWERVRHLERPGGWCHRVLVNLCRSKHRRRSTEARYLARHRRDEATTADVSADVLSFWSAVRELPERPRHAVVLYYAGDRPVAEIATIMNVPEGTVRSDLSRAREALRRELGF